MMREWTAEDHTFSYPWKLMVVAASRKYPNPYSSHVRSLDTLHRKTSGRRLYSHRLIGAMWNIPASISSIIFGLFGGSPLMYVKEQSVCDLDSKTLTIHAQNVSLTEFFTIHETLEYSVSNTDPSQTILKQSASMNVHGIPLLGDVLERVWLNNYKSSVSNGRLGIVSVADKLSEKS